MVRHGTLSQEVAVEVEEDTTNLIEEKAETIDPPTIESGHHKPMS